MNDKQITGFDLTIDGDPDVIQEFLDAFQTKMSQIYAAAWSRSEVVSFGIGRVPLPPTLPVHGTLQLHFREHAEARAE